jgi:hypothetical protein
LVKNWAEELNGLFPGSKTPLNFREIQKEKEEYSESWDSKPLIFTINGKEMEFFSIGQLGLALGGRSSNTLRAWEKDGIIPKSFYIKPSTDPRGRRRMYSRAMVEGMVRIAKEEGVLFPDKGKKLSSTNFTERIVMLFKELRRK